MNHNDSTHHKITWHLSRQNGQIITSEDIDELTDALLELIEARGMQVSGGVMSYDPSEPDDESATDEIVVTVPSVSAEVGGQLLRSIKTALHPYSEQGLEYIMRVNRRPDE